MGSNQGLLPKKKTEYGSISLTLSQSYFVNGDEITGQVVLNIEKPYPMRRIFVKLMGREVITIFKRRRESEFFDKTILLSEADVDPELDALLPKMLNPGVYEYEFSIPTKDIKKLPSTCNYRNSKLSCCVKYILTGYIESYSKEINDLKIEEEISILEKLKAISNKSVTKTTTLRTSEKEYGICSLRVRVDFTGIIVPLGFELLVDYDNSDCKLPVKNIVATITQKMSMHIDDSAKTHIDNKVVAQWKFPGIMEREKGFFNSRLMFETGKDNNLESVNGIHHRKYYTISIYPEYNLPKNCSGAPFVEFDISITSYYQSRKKGESIERGLDPIIEHNDEQNKEEAELGDLVAVPHGLDLAQQ